MIDWLSLVFNSIWIIALALALAVFSMAYYQAQKSGVKFKDVLRVFGFSLALNLSGGLFSLGMALTSDKWWEILLWIILLGLFCYQIYIIRKLKIEE